MRSLWIAMGAAVGLALGGSPDAHAAERHQAPTTTITKVSSNASYASGSSQTNASYANASGKQAAGQFERKCVIMSCGTPWCYNTRVK